MVICWGEYWSCGVEAPRMCQYQHVNTLSWSRHPRTLNCCSHTSECITELALSPQLLLRRGRGSFASIFQRQILKYPCNAQQFWKESPIVLPSARVPSVLQYWRFVRSENLASSYRCEYNISSDTSDNKFREIINFGFRNLSPAFIILLDGQQWEKEAAQHRSLLQDFDPKFPRWRSRWRPRPECGSRMFGLCRWWCAPSPTSWSVPPCSMPSSPTPKPRDYGLLKVSLYVPSS